MKEYLDRRLDPEHPTNVEINLIVQKMSSVLGGKPVLSSIDGLGASDSAHGVFFMRSTKGRHAGTSYAIKRHRYPTKASNEIEMLNTSLALGINTAIPMTSTPVFVEGVVGAVIATRKIPSFSLMTNVGWEKYHCGEEGYNAELVPVLNSLADYTASLHSKGLVHGDLKLKNIGTTPNQGFVTFDLESSSYFSDGKLSSDEFKTEATRDLAGLIKSLVREGFLEAASPEVFVQEVETHILTPYIERTGMDFILSNKYHDILSDYIKYRQRFFSEVVL